MHSHLFIELKWHMDSSKTYINNNWWLSINYDVKYLFITTQSSMNKCIVLKCSNENNMCSNDHKPNQLPETFWREISKCSNEQMPKNQAKGFRTNCMTNEQVLERAPSCSNEQTNQPSTCFWFRCYVIA